MIWKDKIIKMRKFKIFSLMLCAVVFSAIIFAGLLSNTASADIYQGVMDIDIPTPGSTPGYKVTQQINVETVDYTNGYMKNGVLWLKQVNGKYGDYYMQPGIDTFEAGKKYKVRIYFNFKTDPRPVYINNISATVEETDARIKKTTGADYYAECEFEPNNVIENADVIVKLPIAGDLLNYNPELPENAPYYFPLGDINSPTDCNSLRWSYKDIYLWHDVNWKTEPAVEGYVYHVRVWLKANEGYVFTKDTVFSLNNGTIGNNGDITITDGGTYACFVSDNIKCIKPEETYTKINTVNAKISEPVNGKHPDYEPQIKDTEGYLCENFDLKWFDITSGSDVAMNPATGKFEKGHKYRVDINLKSKDGYCFPETGISAKVNDKTAVLSRTDSYNAVLSQTFEIKKDAVSLKLDKSSANVVCGNTLTLKATTNSKDTVNWKSSNSKIATVDSKGKITAKMAGEVTITASVSGKSAKCTVTVLYKDVINSSDFWYAPTNYLTAKGVVKGYANQTEFRPANDCTRAQMITFLYRLQGEPKTKSTTCKFTDVKSTEYFYKPVIWAVEQGITTVPSDKKFNPQTVCTRAMTVTFLWRMAGKPEPKTTKNPFPDVEKTDYFYKATLWASEMKILAGLPDGTFRPQGKCLRRQMVTFLYKYDKYVNGKG
jgi:hypothetical protein